MHRWLGITAVLCVAGATPLVAQEAYSRAPQSAAVTPASSALPGPRLQPEWRRVQPAFADSSASPSPVVAETHTIRMTTIVLILVVVIAVLLLAK